MDFNIEVRKKQLQSLEQYISSSKDKVQSILDYLGWNGKKVLEKQTSINCSVNLSHSMPMKSADEHLKKCSMKTAGYKLYDNFLSEPLHDPTSSIKLDNAKKLEILSQARCNNQSFKAAWNGQDTDPMTADRLVSTFSMDERLVLYDYCVKNTEPPPTPTEFNIHIDDKKAEKLLTEEELLARERDSKRRRMKYKSVHTGNKNHREVIKEVIENQMESYKEYLASQIETNTCTENSNQNINEQKLLCTNPSNLSNNNIIEGKEKLEEGERSHSSFSRHSVHSSSSRSKRDYDNYDNKRESRNYRNGNEDKKAYKMIDKKYDRDDKYRHSPYKERRRYRDHSRDRYRHRSRDKHERYHKSERRH